MFDSLFSNDFVMFNKMDFDFKDYIVVKCLGKNGRPGIDIPDVLTSMV